jgi:hypothetical protein
MHNVALEARRGNTGFHGGPAQAGAAGIGGEERLVAISWPRLAHFAKSGPVGGGPQAAGRDRPCGTPAGTVAGRVR